MGGRKEPLILASTAEVVNSVLFSGELDGEQSPQADLVSNYSSFCSLRLPAGLLHLPGDAKDGSELNGSLEELLCKRGGKEAPYDDAAIVGVTSATLRELSLTSGSWVIVKDVYTSVGRLARVLVLDPPGKNSIEFHKSQKLLYTRLPCSKHMGLLSAYCLPEERALAIDPQVAYLSPQLAFNIGLHLTCLKTLIGCGKESFASLFSESVSAEKMFLNTTAEVEIIPSTVFHQSPSLVLPRHLIHNFEGSQPIMPRYASHLRISFVKIPSSGVLDGLKSSIYSLEAKERQEMIDTALHHYFKVDRVLARGDVFSIQLDWKCMSEICSHCNKKTATDSSDDIIYFKVMAMEPLNEAILRVNCNQTALVLGGSVPSQVPPAFMVIGGSQCTPLQEDIARQLASLLAPCLHPSAFTYKFKMTVLLHGPGGCGKRTVVRQVAKSLGLHVVEYNCYDLLGASERKTSAALEQAFNTAQRYAPVILLLRRFHALGKSTTSGNMSSDHIGSASQIASVLHQFTQAHLNKKEDVDADEMKDTLNTSKTWGLKEGLVFLVAAADSTEDITSSIRRCFSHEISMGAPTEAQRIKLLSDSVHSVATGSDNDSIDLVLKDIAGQTSGFMPRDIRAIIADAGAHLVSRIMEEDQKNELNENTRSLDVRPNAMEKINEYSNTKVHSLCKEDLEKALDRMKKRTASALGTPKVPNVKWDDVGGLKDVKKAILDTIQMPLLHKELFSSGLHQCSGVLLYGPPGMGKGPELINMYIGESKNNVRDFFQKARAARPCVIFFDELDALAPARGASGDSGGVMDRVVSQARCSPS